MYITYICILLYLYTHIYSKVWCFMQPILFIIYLIYPHIYFVFHFLLSSFTLFSLFSKLSSLCPSVWIFSCDLFSGSLILSWAVSNLPWKQLIALFISVIVLFSSGFFFQIFCTVFSSQPKFWILLIVPWKY